MQKRHIYLFAGFPGKALEPGSVGLNAGGLAHCIENVEGLAILEYDPAIQARKEGLFVVAPSGAWEQISNIQIHLSDRIIQDGITENWFNENYTIGNGVNCPKTEAKFQLKEVNHQCGRTKVEMMEQDGFLDSSTLRTHMVHDFTEGWGVYERRWRSGMCPQEDHVVHLTTMLVQHELNAFAYGRIMGIIESSAQPERHEMYDHSEPGRHFSVVREFRHNKLSLS